MEDLKTEIITYFTGVCKCCMQEGTFKSLWDEYMTDGEKEIYGQMLTECFALPWFPPDSDIVEQICEECIWKLRGANSFKKQVLSTQEKLQDQFENAYNEEKSDVKTEQLIHNNADITDHDYQDIEYLDDAEVSEAVAAATSPICPKIDHPLTSKGTHRVYKKYREDDLTLCLASVKSGAMSCRSASKKFNVPRKTISEKLRRQRITESVINNEVYEFDSPEQQASFYDRLKFDMFRHDLIQILHYTNAIPFRNRNVHTYCMYCNPVAKGKFFEDFEELRTHVRTVHEYDKVSKISEIVSPRWRHEIVKVDIENLHCKQCSLPLKKWDDLFIHMKQTHDLELEEGRKRVVPFVVKSVMKCVFCDEQTHNLHHLDAHMNCHYDNYICNECGATFVAHIRWAKHVQIHGNDNKYPCEHCGKIFTRDLYRKKHIQNFHRRQTTIKCFYCDERMAGEVQRHKHVLEHHKDKVKIFACEYCGKTFSFRPNYMKHLRRQHREFSKLPPERIELEKKMHFCTICKKKYSSVAYLKRHIAKEHDDERIKILEVVEQEDR